ncbi:hypothetical protein F4810DRAFT_151946 [Camillea tinctor]|nr:hypothetical protein F4810DRAFT_151946 [Camillea tinctor]
MGSTPTLPLDTDLHQYIGGDAEGLLYSMNKIAKLLSRDLVLVCACGDLRDTYPEAPAEESRLIRFELGPKEGADLECPAFLVGIQKSWLDLIQIYAEIVAGKTFNMEKRLRDLYWQQLVVSSPGYVTACCNMGRPFENRFTKRIGVSLAGAQTNDTEHLAKLLALDHRAVMDDARRKAAVIFADTPDSWVRRRSRLEAFVVGKEGGEFSPLEWRDLVMLMLQHSKDLGRHLVQRELNKLKKNKRSLNQIKRFATKFILEDVSKDCRMSGLLERYFRHEIVRELFVKLPTAFYAPGTEGWLVGIREEIDPDKEA